MKTLWIALFLLFSAQSYGSSESFGSWSVVAQTGILIASTTNESGNFISKSCFLQLGRCSWNVTLPIKCKENEVFTIILSKSNAAIPRTLICIGFSEELSKYIYEFDKFEEFDEIIKNSSRISIAFPLQSDQFSIIRFNNEGSEKAIDFFNKIIQKVVDKDIKSTKDEYL